jgi:hypothetical protein
MIDRHYQTFQRFQSTKHLLYNSSPRRGHKMTTAWSRFEAALDRLEVKGAIVRVGRLVYLQKDVAKRYNWEFRGGTCVSNSNSNSQNFCNAQLARIFTESHSRSAEGLQKARGKRQSVIITIIFPRFNPLPNFSFFGTVIFLYLGPILYCKNSDPELGPFSHITAKTYPQVTMKMFSQVSVANIISLHNSANAESPTKTGAISVRGQNQPTPAILTEFLSDCYCLDTPRKCFYCKNRNEIEGHELHICKAVEQQEAPTGHPIEVVA